MQIIADNQWCSAYVLIIWAVGGSGVSVAESSGEGGDSGKLRRRVAGGWWLLEVAAKGNGEGGDNIK